MTCSIVGIQWGIKGMAVGRVMFPGLMYWVEWDQGDRISYSSPRWRVRGSGSENIRLPWSPDYSRDASWCSAVLADLFSHPPGESDSQPLAVVVFWTTSRVGYRLSIGARNAHFRGTNKAPDPYSPPDWFDRSLFPESAVFEVMNS